MNNKNKVKKIGFGGLLFSLITYGYIAWDDLKGKYLLNESDYIQVHGKVVYSAVIEKKINTRELITIRRLNMSFMQRVNYTVLTKFILIIPHTIALKVLKKRCKNIQ